MENSSSSEASVGSGMTKSIYCLRCPRGCLLQVEEEGEQIVVSGNACKLGEAFALQEIRSPRRLFTSSLCVRGGTVPVVSVMSSQPILRDDIPRWVELCRTLEVEAPVVPEMCVAKNPFGDGIDLITTWYVERDNDAENQGR